MKEFFLKYRIPLIIIMLVFALLIAIRSIRFVNLINNKGVYVIAVITEVRRGKSGYYADAYFLIKDEKRTVTSVHFGVFNHVKIGERFFLKVLPEDPELYMIVRDVPVPSCYDNEEGMGKSWKEIPTCMASGK